MSTDTILNRASIDEQLWFPTRGGRFAVTVNQHKTALHMADAHGQYIGAFSSLEIADRESLTRKQWAAQA